MEEITAPLRPAKTACLIPTFNNAATLADVVERALRQLPDVLVVDDGSTDGTREILAGFGERIRLLRLDVNRGKGAALRSGFEFLRQSGFTHAAALDSDGQHYPEDLPAFLAASRERPEAILVGERDMGSAGAPRKSRFGLWFSNGALRAFAGVRLRDSQCGFRTYPLEPLAGLELRGDRYDLELEVLIRAGRSGIPILPVPIRVTYSPPGGRVTHFRPVRDFLRIALQVGRTLADGSRKSEVGSRKSPGSRRSEVGGRK